MRYPSLGRSAAFVLFASLAACSSKKDPAPEATTISWSADGSAETATQHVTVNNPTTYELAGFANPEAPSNNRVSITIPKAVGTYSFGPNSVARGEYIITTPTKATGYYAGVEPSTGAFVGSGTIVVTELTTTRLAGTFTFTAVDEDTGTGATKSITNGKFFVNL